MTDNCCPVWLADITEMHKVIKSSTLITDRHLDANFMISTTLIPFAVLGCPYCPRLSDNITNSRNVAEASYDGVIKNADAGNHNGIMNAGSQLEKRTVVRLTYRPSVATVETDVQSLYQISTILYPKSYILWRWSVLNQHSQYKGHTCGVLIKFYKWLKVLAVVIVQSLIAQLLPRRTLKPTGMRLNRWIHRRQLAVSHLYPPA